MVYVLCATFPGRIDIEQSWIANLGIEIGKTIFVILEEDVKCWICWLSSSTELDFDLDCGVFEVKRVETQSLRRKNHTSFLDASLGASFILPCPSLTLHPTSKRP